MPCIAGAAGPESSEAQQAFVKFVVAGMRHFKGNKIIWELWNEYVKDGVIRVNFRRKVLSVTTGWTISGKMPM